MAKKIKSYQFVLNATKGKLLGNMKQLRSSRFKSRTDASKALAVIRKQNVEAKKYPDEGIIRGSPMKPQLVSRGHMVSNPASKRAGKLWEEFQGKEVDGDLIVKLPEHLDDINLPDLTFLGMAAELAYVTKKEGDEEPIEYHHRFSGDTLVFAHPESKKGYSFIALIGPFEVRSEGVTG